VLGLGRDIADGEDITPFMFRSTAFDNLPYFWGQGGELVDAGVAPQRVATIENVEELSRAGRNDRVAMFVGNNDLIEREFKNVVEDDSWRRWRVAQIPMGKPDQFATGVGGFAEGTFRDGDDGAAAATKDFISKFVEPASACGGSSGRSR